MSDNSAALAIDQSFDVVDPHLHFVHGVITRRVQESIAVKQRLLGPALVDAIARLSDEVVNSVRAGGKVILFGNGGSAADATHIAAEFVGRFAFDRDPMPALSLSDNVSAITAIGNDYAYDLTFARQLRALGSPGDIAIGLSTSGASPNVLNALRVAREKQIFSAAFTGAQGAEMAALADLAVVIPSDATARIQEAYMLSAHIVCEIVEQTLFGLRVVN
jgi:D-sedoheptulose 7-phosphate isomerase